MTVAGQSEIRVEALTPHFGGVTALDDISIRFVGGPLQSLIEVTDPATGMPLPPGETGEVVVTSPNETYPLVRFGTGDLSAAVPGVCECGRTTSRLKRFLGRVGEGVKVKGMFVHPQQIGLALNDHSGVAMWQGAVAAAGHTDLLTVRVVAKEGAGLDLDAVKRSLEEAVKVGLELEVVEQERVGEHAGQVMTEGIL